MAPGSRRILAVSGATAPIAIVVSGTAAIPAAAMVAVVAGRGIFALARTTATITVIARGAPAIAVVPAAAIAAGAVTVAVVVVRTLAVIARATIAIALAGSRRVLAVARTATAIAVVADIARLTGAGSETSTPSNVTIGALAPRPVTCSATSSATTAVCPGAISVATSCT